MGSWPVEVIRGQVPEVFLYGSGSDYGDGYCSGYGSGYGDGYCSGYGYGYGDVSYHQAICRAHPRAAELEANGCTLALWRSRADGTPANGGSGKPAKVGDIQTVSAESPYLCSDKALHGTLWPHKWSGKRWWVVALYPPVVGDADKFGSLKREIIADLGECPYPER
jgi:hypothetical protein